MNNLFLKITAISCIIFTSCENNTSELDLQENDDTLTQSSQSARVSAWSQVFRDDFNTNSNITNKWERTNGRTDYNSDVCHYKSWLSSLKTHDGKQCLELKAQKINNNEYRSGHVKSDFSFKPNNNEEFRVRARIKLIAKNGNDYKGFGDTYGAWPAFWTVQENSWPTKGEIDIMEGYSYAPAATNFASNLFYGTNTGRNDLGTNANHEYAVSEGWHTYEMRWKKNSNGWGNVNIYLDGKKKKNYNNSNVDNLKLNKFGSHNIILNLNVGDNFGIFDNSRINLFSNTFMYVDWVQVQKRTL